MTAVIIEARGTRLSWAAKRALLEQHYLARLPRCLYGFEAWRSGDLVAVLTVGVPASRQVQVSACPSAPNKVCELTRLWIQDSEPKGFASWFIARALRILPALVIVSSADTAAGHDGTVYRAANFKYAGWSDMDRKSPRFDYVPSDGTHSRNAFRTGDGLKCERVPRLPKAKYWTLSGTKRESRGLGKLVAWPSLSWAMSPVPTQHMQYRAPSG